MQETEIRNGRNSNSNVVFQPSRLVQVTASTGTFTMGERGFLIKIDSTDPVTLTVQYLLGKRWITTTFFPGWNPDLIYAIDTQQQIAVGSDIKAGF